MFYMYNLKMFAMLFAKNMDQNLFCVKSILGFMFCFTINDGDIMFCEHKY